MIILIGLFILSVVCVILGRRSERAGAKYVTLFLASLFPAVLGLISLFFILFASRHPAVTCAVAAGALVTIEYLISCIIFRWFRIRKRRSALIALSAGLAVFSCCFYGYWAYVDSIPTVDEGRYALLSRYDPREANSILARLDDPASLSIAEDLPRLDGATALYPVYAAFANAVYPESAFTSAQDEIVSCSTTGHAFRALVDGEADIIFCAAPSEEQLAYAAEKGEEMILTPIGRECFVFFVNSKNPIENLTVSQIRDIYSGKVTQWRDLGVNMGAIRAFQRDEGSGSQSALIRFMGDTPLMEAPTENVLGDMGGIIEKTADYRNFKNAIGYSFRFYASEMVKNEQIRLLSLEGAAPTRENILNGKYPVSDCFYAITLASNDNPNVDRFIRWMLSEEGQTLIDKTGYVPVG